MLADTLLLLTKREMVEGYNTSAFCSNLILGSQQNYPFLYCNVICTKASITNNRIFTIVERA